MAAAAPMAAGGAMLTANAALLRAVPDVLMSGHHGDIARWRRDRALEWTARRRPDLIVAARAEGRLSPADESTLRRLAL